MRLFFLFPEGILSVTPQLSKTEEGISYTVANEFNNLPETDLAFRYIASGFKLTDIFVTSSGNFIVALTADDEFLILDYTLNLYWAVNAGKIEAKSSIFSISNGGHLTRPSHFAKFNQKLRNI